jgi:hypothetical protein
MVAGMPPYRSVRLVVLATTLAALAALVVAPSVRSTGPSSGRSDARPASQQYPTNAGKIYRWGNAQWHDEFIGPVTRMWSINHRRLVDNQHGMLTINATKYSGTVSATVTGHGRRYGRWEARVRAQQYSHAHTPYHVVTELIPTGPYACGRKSIVMEGYPLGTNRARMFIRNGKDEFTYGKGRDLGAGPFHTYAVEVTKSHISWFVDAHVVMTERRPAALSGTDFKVRFRMLAPKGARVMNPGRMQMDWVRYYTLARHNARSIAAPEAFRRTDTATC